MTERRLAEAPGRVVLKPGTRERLSAQGEVVTWNADWCRYLADGDVIDLTNAKPPRAAKPATPDRTRTE